MIEHPLVPFRIRRVVAGLWAWVLCWVGVAFCWQSDSRTAAPNYTQVRAWGAHVDPARPMLVWGVLFLTAGLAAAGGVIAGSVRVTRPALRAATGLGWVFAVGGAFASALANGGSWSAVGFGQGIVGALAISTWRLTDTWGM